MQQEQQQQPASSSFIDFLTEGPLRLIVALVIPVIGFIVMWQSFLYMRDSEASKISIAAIALVVGVFGIWFLYWATNNLIESLPEKSRDALRPYLFVGPAMVVLTVFLIYPTVNTLVRSVMNDESTEFVGLDNFERIFSDDELIDVLRNNVLWIMVVTSIAVTMGLLIAVLVDRIGRWEPVAKALIFLPMAISAVGASVIWKFMYESQSEPGKAEIGFINAVRKGVFGADEAIPFIREQPINNYALMFIMIWLLTGFCMVILSAAIKGVPNELLEAGRIDGANEIQIFFRVIVPVIGPTILTVSTTVLIMVLKVFDIVYVMGGALYGTDVIANRMFRELFTYQNFGLGSALASILLFAVLPLIFWNIHQLRKARR